MSELKSDMNKKKQLRYVSACEDIREIIRVRGLRAGDKLPSENELANLLGVSRGTLRQAMTLLKESGAIYNHQGKGSFLRMGLENGRRGLECVQADLMDYATVEIEECKLKVEYYPSTNTMMQHFEREESTLLAQFHLFYRHGGEIIAYRLVFVPYEYLDKNKVELSDNQALLDFLKHLQSVAVGGSISFTSVDARESVAAKMAKKTGVQLLYFSEKLRLKTGEVVMYAKSYLCPDYFSFFLNRA